MQVPLKQIAVRQARQDEAALIVHILNEAANWLIDTGRPLWRDNELEAATIFADTAAGQYYLAMVTCQPAGCFRLDLEDALFWPDCPPGEALYLHRLAVLRRFAGGEVSHTMLLKAQGLVRQCGRQFLRLDSEIGRDKLCRLYERHGFRRHSQLQVPPYHVIRWELPL